LIANCLEKDRTSRPKEDALKEIYKKLRPVSPRTPRTPRSCSSRCSSTRSRYDLAGVGRYKLNGKLEGARDPKLREYSSAGLPRR